MKIIKLYKREFKKYHKEFISLTKKLLNKHKYMTKSDLVYELEDNLIKKYNSYTNMISFVENTISNQPEIMNIKRRTRDLNVNYVLFLKEDAKKTIKLLDELHSKVSNERCPINNRKMYILSSIRFHQDQINKYKGELKGLQQR